MVVYNEILVRYGELSTKGKNRGQFINRLAHNMQNVLSDLPVKVQANRDHAHVILDGAAYEEVAERLKKVFGLQSFSPSIRIEADIARLKDEVLALFKMIYKEGMTFKIQARRANHDFELDSTEINQTLGDLIFDNFDYAKVQMKFPDIAMRVEVRSEAIFLSYETIKGAGGLPVGTAGRGHLMLSGGIDSPVAGYLALKRGVEIEAVHFASPPYTSPGALKKAKDLTGKLTAFGGAIQFIEVPFTEIQEEIRDKAPQTYLMTLTRRFMLRIVDKIRELRDGKIIINGESLGQVASQTLGSMEVINAVTNTPIIRPVVTMDKLEIIDIAEKIDTFNLSILPFEDCCTIFAPPNPKTNPKLDKAEFYEQKLDVEGLVARAVAGIKIDVITGDNTDEVATEEFSDLL
ncbi:MAG: tRNA 4-thiouridine(8) synthase ThiI [Streptococcaceae bacterium]|jgi:thiamine biosynthesis protein ThiI|nr:tRNA 4-thiouridine(8) synthase ThiI [Streptococcaceae bacterium]